MIAAILAVLIGIIASLVTAELSGRTGKAAKWLICRAVSRLPFQHRARYREEWLAEYASLNTLPITKIWFAVSVFLSSGYTARTIASVPRIIAGRDLIWGEPDAETHEGAYEEAVRELARGNLDTAESDEEKQYRHQWIRRVHMPPEAWRKHGKIEVAPGAWIEVAPLTFNLLIKIWKRIILEDEDE